MLSLMIHYLIPIRTPSNQCTGTDLIYRTHQANINLRNPHCGYLSYHTLMHHHDHQWSSSCMIHMTPNRVISQSAIRRSAILYHHHIWSIMTEWCRMLYHLQCALYTFRSVNHTALGYGIIVRITNTNTKYRIDYVDTVTNTYTMNNHTSGI